MAKLGDKIRKNLIYDEIPEVLVDAIIATEDSRFSNTMELTCLDF